MGIDFDEIWQKCSKDSRMEFACFNFRAGLLFLINFSSFKLTPMVYAIQQKVIHSWVSIALHFQPHILY